VSGKKLRKRRSERKTAMLSQAEKQRMQADWNYVPMIAKVFCWTYFFVMLGAGMTGHETLGGLMFGVAIGAILVSSSEGR
jgi:hypothetical protein